MLTGFGRSETTVTPLQATRWISRNLRDGRVARRVTAFAMEGGVPPGEKAWRPLEFWRPSTWRAGRSLGAATPSGVEEVDAHFEISSRNLSHWGASAACFYRVVIAP